MGEQRVKKVQVVPGPLSSAGAEQAVGLIMFVDAEGAPAGAALSIPAPPVEDGTYNLQVVVASGAATYSWVAAA